MSTIMYFLCVLAYILGQALLLFWITIPKLKEKCRIANKLFTWTEWWKCDASIVIGNLCFAALAILLLSEFVQWKPDFILKWVLTIFALLGAFGTTIAQERWGQFQKGINNLIDIKSNIADAVTGGTTTVKETIAKGTDATGQDVSVSPKP